METNWATSQDREVCWPTLHKTPKDLLNVLEKTISRNENYSEVLRNARAPQLARVGLFLTDHFTVVGLLFYHAFAERT